MQLSTACRSTKEVTVSSRQLSLLFFHLSSFHFSLPKIMLKEPPCVPLRSTPLHCNKGCTSPLLLGFDQVPILKSGGNFANQQSGLPFHPSASHASERHCYVSSSGIAQVAIRQARKSLLTACGLMWWKPEWDDGQRQAVVGLLWQL